MKTREEKIEYINNHISQTRVKWDGNEETMERAYRNVKVAMTKQANKDARNRKITAEDVVQALDSLLELETFEKDLKVAMEERRKALRDAQREKLTNDILDMRERLKQAENELERLQ